VTCHRTCPPASMTELEGAAPLRQCPRVFCEAQRAIFFGNENQHHRITFNRTTAFPQSGLYIMSQGPTNVGAHWPADQEDVLNASRDRRKRLEGMPNWI
jgi:hypothetical protein